ncbi:MarR family winged helix-turn-helix transcriptional regulator [Piscinibacter gummiphilus]|uniref:MarR family winged helix-turn-helix transcriptional regulator n=1 Tax=Piscinibacter gummiphilus TaxID=946333 RepID=A0ABZ0CMB2_9BURK|nr:MarR family winged helix-turn-helix transcriptional regulator [Piscinibacter gummiphilus]WOB06110.1 MarR family winged helix-turn-helix transcriptional regulator [Piscinibacter gummiphilus]
MSSPEPLDFGVLLNVAFAAFREALDADLAAAGFDDIGTSFGYVFRLLAEVPCNLSELAAQLGMSSPGALKVVDDMVAKGYVSRSTDADDRRVKRLALTARGRAALSRARAFHARYEQAVAERLGAREVAATRKVLEAMAASQGERGGRMPRPV